MQPFAPARCSGIVISLLVALAACGAVLGAGRAIAQTGPVKRILELPPVQWDADGVRWRYARQQTDSDFARATGGMIFGMRPEEVNPLLPHPAAALHWDEMPVASEYVDEVRYTWVHMKVANKMVAPVRSCYGAASYIVVQFRASGLFRISWRFLPDAACPDVTHAAAELFASFVPIASTVALSVHYRTGYAEVVDVTDPRSGLLVTQRWQMRGQ